MGHYSRQVTMPKTRREGLRNFVQMIINDIEAENYQEALLRAVDLCDEFEGSGYSDVIEGERGKNVRDAIDAALKEAAAKHAEVLAQATSDAYERGIADERKRMAAVLGLTA